MSREEPSAVCLFSLTRMGSSVTAYAVAEAVGGHVLDEPLGPWDRTGPPYNYPAIQGDLRSAFNRAKGRLNDEVADLLKELCQQVGERVVIKLPHLQVSPEAHANYLADFPAVYLLRNPLRRLNSLFTRRWNHFTRPQHDLETTREYLRRWIHAGPEARAGFETLQSDPTGFFGGLLRSWSWPSDAGTVARAVAYRSQNYHESSAERHEARSPTGVLSDHRRHVPLEAVRAYLDDPLVAAVFAMQGWPTDPSVYSEEVFEQDASLASRIRQKPVPEPGGVGVD